MPWCDLPVGAREFASLLIDGELNDALALLVQDGRSLTVRVVKVDLACISHTFLQNRLEAPDSLVLPYLGEKQSVWRAGSAAPQNPDLCLARGEASYWL